MLSLAAWSPLGVVVGDIGSIVVDPPSAYGPVDPLSFTRELSARREDNDETAGAQHETNTTVRN